MRGLTGGQRREVAAAAGTRPSSPAKCQAARQLEAAQHRVTTATSPATRSLAPAARSAPSLAYRAARKSSDRLLLGLSSHHEPVSHRQTIDAAA
jgi:hypothetical protein